MNSKSIATNVDTIIIGGCYDVNPNTQGILPLNGGYALLFVRTANTTWIYQDLIYTDTTALRHYQRMKINDRDWTQWNEYVVNSDLIAQQIPATLLNGWTAPHLDNQLITYKIGNLYLINGIIQSPSTITENTYNVANLNLPFNFSGQGCVNISLDGEKFLYLTSYNDGLLHDQYRHTIPDSVYMIKGFFIH